MAERFRAFSFVDQITELDPGVRAVGRYAIPLPVARFPASLVAESVGQLAAWASMAKLEFRRRPVAGLAGQVDFLAAASPGETLDLEVHINTCDDDAVAYGGSASIGGERIVVLADCVGPMLPIEEFDDPAALLRDLETLLGPGAPAGRFSGVAARATNILDRIPGERVRAELRVPGSAPFFGDHFPRRPVFPGTLLLDSQIELALALARELPAFAGRSLVPACVRDVKIRAFTPPGQVLELRVEVLEADADRATLSLAARGNGKPVSTGRVEIVSGRAG